MDGQQRPRPQVRLAVAHQLVVRPVAHQLGQLGRIGDVERLDRDVRLGVAGAVPVEVVTARAPAAPVVLADRDLGVLRVVLPLHVAEGTPDRQLPADVGLGLERLAALLEGQGVQGAAGAEVEVVAIVEDAGALAVDLDGAGLRLALLVVLDPVGLAHLRPVRPELPRVRVELVDVRLDPLAVLLVGEVRAEGAAAGVGRLLVDAGAALAEDARVVGREPREVAAEHLRLVGRIDELDEGAGKDEVDFRHDATLRAG